MQLLRQNPNVRQINAELKPGSSPGQSLLDVQVEDQQPFRVGLQFDNQRPPSVGAEQFSLLARPEPHRQQRPAPVPLRNCQRQRRWSGVFGSGQPGGQLCLAVNRYDTSIGLHGSRLNTSIVEDPLLPLAITSLTKSFGLVLRQPVYQRPNQEVAVSVGFDRSENQSWLLGEPFNVSPGAVDGEMVVSVLRLSQEWLQRGPNHVLALRSTFNLGLDVWDATDNGVPGDPDANFFSWLGQAQYVRRLFNTQNQVILRLPASAPPTACWRWSKSAWAASTACAAIIENQLVRDRGLISSIEFRVPVLFDKSGAGMLHLAPFFDFGGGWNNEGSPDPTTICSTGLGVLFTTGKHFSAEIYWGHRFQDVDIPDDAGLQGHGVGFKINMSAF